MHTKIQELFNQIHNHQASRSVIVLRDLLSQTKETITTLQGLLEEKGMALTQVRQEYRILREANLRLGGQLEAQEGFTKRLETLIQPTLASPDKGTFAENVNKTITEWWTSLADYVQEELFYEIDNTFGLPKEVDSRLLGTARGSFGRDLTPEERKTLRNSAREFVFEKKVAEVGQ